MSRARWGYRDLTVADISPAALGQAQAQLGSAAQRVQRIEADVRSHDLHRRYDIGQVSDPRGASHRTSCPVIAAMRS